jgi:hypothetical protein
MTWLTNGCWQITAAKVDVAQVPVTANSQFRGDAELAREEEHAQIEDAAVLAIACETD